MIHLESGQTKHIITSHTNLVNGRLVAATYCGWIYIERQMEGAYPYEQWWTNPAVADDMCAHCVHVAGCKATGECAGCDASDAEDRHPIHR